MRRLSHILPIGLSLAACDPAPKNAGEVPGTGGAETDDGQATAADSGDDPIPAEPGVDGSLELGSSVGIWELEPAENGGVVAALVADYPTFHVTVKGLSATLTEQWSIELPGAYVQDLAWLDDGTYLMVGSTGPEDLPVPTAWRLSCCGDVLQTQTFPVPAPGASMSVGQPLGDGLLLVYSNGFESGVIRTSMDLVEQGSEGSLPFAANQGAPTAAGTVLLSGLEGPSGAHVLWEVQPDAIGLGFGDGQIRSLVGEGEALVMMSPGFEQVWFEPQAGGAVKAAHIPGFEITDYVAARRDRFGFAHTISDDTASTTHVLEFDGDGNVYRDVPVPTMSAPFAFPTAIEVATDDGIFVGIRENGPGEPGIARLYHLPPL